jgi:hypothetical protein
VTAGSAGRDYREATMPRTIETHPTAPVMRPRRRALGALALALAASAVAASTAQAATWRNTGSPGGVALPRIYGFRVAAPSVPSCMFCDEVNAYMVQHQGGFAAYMPARRVSRAPFAGAQAVTVQYRLFHKNSCSDYALANRLCDDGFKLYRTYTGQYTIGASAGSTTVPDWAQYVPPNWPEGVAFGMDVIVTWRTPAGAFLGRTWIDENAAGDYGCLTQLCTIGSDAKRGAWLVLNN